MLNLGRVEGGAGQLWVAAAAVASLAALGTGCATAGSAESSDSDRSEEERRIPPEVADESIDDRSESARSVQPQVEVEFDAEELPGIDVAAYEATVQRHVQKCYTRRVYGGELQSEGTMAYEVLVTRNGHVAGADRVSTDLRDDPLQSCVEGALGRLRFEISSPNKPVYRLYVRFQFSLETLVPSEPPV